METSANIAKALETAKTILSDGSTLFILAQSGIWAYDPKSKESKQLVSEDFSTTVVCACLGTAHIYSVHSDNKIKKISIHHGTVEIISTQNFSSTKAVLYVHGTLILYDTIVWQFFPEDSTYKQYIAEDWSSTKTGLSHGDVGIVAVNAVWYVNHKHASIKAQLTGDWSNTRAIVVAGETWYAIEKKLFSIDLTSSNSYKEVPITPSSEDDDFSNVVAAAGANGLIYGLWESGSLWEINANAGTKTKIIASTKVIPKPVVEELKETQEKPKTQEVKPGSGDIKIQVKVAGGAAGEPVILEVVVNPEDDVQTLLNKFSEVVPKSSGGDLPTVKSLRFKGKELTQMGDGETVPNDEFADSTLSDLGITEGSQLVTILMCRPT